MPTRKGTKRSKNKKGGGDDISTMNNFTSARMPSSVNNASATPASATPASAMPASASASAEKTTSWFSPKASASSASRLLSVPASAVASASLQNKSGSSLLLFTFVFLFLCFLALTLFLYLEKPVGTSMNHLYDPLLKFIGFNPQTNQAVAIKKLEKTLDKKEIVNKIDTTTTQSNNTTQSNMLQKTGEGGEKYKKPPVIPLADDTTSRLQMTPKSKAGFCYIGEDRGFRSCIEVGEGDICMSGDIFPTQDICINPNLRE